MRIHELLSAKKCKGGSCFGLETLEATLGLSDYRHRTQKTSTRQCIV